MLKSIVLLSVLLSPLMIASSSQAYYETVAPSPVPPTPGQTQMQILQVQPGSLTHILAGVPTEVRCAPASVQTGQIPSGPIAVPTPVPVDPFKCTLAKKSPTSGYDYYYVVQNGKAISPETESMDAAIETLRKLQAAAICKQ